MHKDTIEKLRATMAALKEDAEKMQAAADAAGRGMTDEEVDAFTALVDQYEQAKEEITRRERILAMEAEVSQSAGRRVAPNPLPGVDDVAQATMPRVSVSAPNITKDPKLGFASMGHFAMEVKKAYSSQGRTVHPNLLIANAALGTTGNTESGEDGGFAIPPDFRSAIMVKVNEEAPLLGLTDQQTTSSNRIVFPTDETTPWENTGGVQAYWDDELQQMTASKPKIGDTTVRLNRLTALVRMSEEALEDAAQMDTYLRRKAPEKIAYKVSRAILAGTGAGQPLGILNSPAKVAVAIEQGPQTADTVVFQNIVKMWARLPASSMGRAVWIANQDVLPQLLSLAFPTATATPVPMFIPPGGLPNSPSGSLMGRPIIFTEAANTLGDEGDLMLVDFSQYMTAQKVGGIRADVSMHLYFDYAAMAYRFLFRLGGQPWWSKPTTKAQGGASATLSPYVTLAAR